MIKKYWDYIITFLGALIGLLWYFLSMKGRELKKYKTAAEMAETEREVDLIEIEINTLKGEKKLSEIEIKKLNEQLENLKQKRVDIKEHHKNMTPREIVEYWNKE